MPWTIPSPKNQWGDVPVRGFDPLRTYSPARSRGSEPSTCSSVAVISSDTGANPRCSHHGWFGSSGAVVGGGAALGVAREPEHAANAIAPADSASTSRLFHRAAATGAA